MKVLDDLFTFYVFFTLKYPARQNIQWADCACTWNENADTTVDRNNESILGGKINLSKPLISTNLAKFTFPPCGRFAIHRSLWTTAAATFNYVPQQQQQLGRSIVSHGWSLGINVYGQTNLSEWFVGRQAGRLRGDEKSHRYSTWRGWGLSSRSLMASVVYRAIEPISGHKITPGLMSAQISPPLIAVKVCE